MLFLWIVLCVSSALWLVIGFRIKHIENTTPSLDCSSPAIEPAGGWPFVSIIAPARNEEREVRQCLLALTRQDYPSYELIFVDDRSTDATLRIAREALSGCAFCRIVAGAPRPPQGWVGKNWALVQGVDRAQGDWLLFVDSDVMHHPLTLRKAVAKAFELDVDALSILPSIDCHSFWEKTIMPLFAALSALIEPMDLANRIERRSSRLSGAFTLIRRDAYLAAGSHAAVRDQIVEDLALARILKRQGRRIWLTYTRDLTNTRMYDSFHDLWSGLSRLSFPMMNYSVALLAAAYAAALIGTFAPWLALAGGILRRNAPVAIAGLAIAGFSRMAIEPVFHAVKISARYAWFLPIGASLYCLAATHAAIRHFTGLGIEWKRRTYASAS